MLENKLSVLVIVKAAYSTHGEEQLYQSQEHACSGNGAELIAFNPYTADNTEAGLCRLREQ